MIAVIRFGRPLGRLGFAFSLAAALLVSLGSPAQAAGGVTGALSGTLVDQRTGAPLSGVTVDAVSPSGSFKAITNEHGFFSLLQLPTDTYVVSFEKNGFAPASVSGVTLLGDQTQSVGTVRLTPSLRTIATVRTSARSNSAFQPNQTTDEYTFSGAKVDEALGEKGSTNFNQLVLSAPGVIQTAQGSNNPISIRGSASVEIGYQFDGVDFRGSFFDENPNQGFLNGVGAGHGSLQVVSGSGDATQGGIGAGVVNIIPGRGTYPGDGFVSLDVGAPYFDHALALQYGIATKDGRISDFLSTRSERAAPTIAPFGRDASDAGAYFGPSLTYDDDVLNNFYYRFGKNKSQQIQVLSDFIDHRAYGNYGGLQYAAYYPYNPLAFANFSTDNVTGAPFFGCLHPARCYADPNNGALIAAEQMAQYAAIIPYVPGVPRSPTPVYQPEQYIFGPTNFLKIGYSRSLGNATALNAFFYNWGGLVANNITGNSSDLTNGAAVPGYNNAGGRKVGFQAQVSAQAGQKHILSLVGKFENGFPYWVQQNVGNTFQGLFAARGQDEANFSGSTGLAPTPLIANGPRIEDWFLPVSPGSPVNAQTNPCVGPAYDNGFNAAAPTTMGCYLYSWLLAHGKWNGHLPNVPATGFNYNQTDFQQFGIGVRDQWSPSAKLHVDYGVRVDGQNLRWRGSSFNLDPSNTADVGTGFAQLTKSYLHPLIVQPRLSVDFVPTPTNSFRFSYGRSASFYFGQTAGTPTDASYIDPLLRLIPAKDSALLNPASGQLGPACGSGWHGPGKNQNGAYVQNPYVYFSGNGTLAVPGYYFKCPNYAESVYWAFDQGYSAPDIGGQQPATYNNWDIAWGHQFKNGFGTKLTAYWRRGYNTYTTVLLNGGPPNPVTGQQTAGSFQERQDGVQKAFGLEFLLTTPERPYGWGGFFTANYVNELTSTPPVSGSDSLPVVAQYLYQTGTLFHQSFLPPVSARAGVQYRMRNGIRINPIFSFDGGEPFGVGRDAVGFVNGVLYHLPTGNLGVSTPYAGPGLPNQSYNATCYVDPAFAGSYFKPKNFACRGYSEPALAGQAYTRPRLFTNLDVEAERGNVTFGLYVTNLFDNYRGQPLVNNDWQPVATGRGGLQTGKYANAYPVNYDGSPNQLYQTGGRNASVYDQYWLPYQELYGQGRTYRVYAQFKL